MSWNCDARLTEQDYYHQNQRVAFRAGYSDAFHGAPMWAGNERDWHPDEYRAGYDAGAADKALTIDAEDSDDDEQTFSLETMTAAIYKLRADYIANGDYDSYQAINAGGCEDFASDIHELVGSPREDADYQMIDPAYFLQAPAQGDDDNWVTRLIGTIFSQSGHQSSRLLDWIGMISTIYPHLATSFPARTSGFTATESTTMPKHPKV